MPGHDGFPVRGPRPPVTEPGVPTPYVAHRHPYPTRYHGGIWTRPVTAPATYMTSVQSVFKPDNFNENNPGIVKMGIHGLGALQYQTYEGVFSGQKHGGGIFSGPLYGLGPLGSLGVEITPTFTLKTETATAERASPKTEAPSLSAVDSRVRALQGYLNRALSDAGLATLTQDGKLGPKTCGAIAWYAREGRPKTSGTTRARIDENLSYVGYHYDAACKQHTPWRMPAKPGASSPVSAPPKGPVTEAPLEYKAPGLSAGAKAAIGIGVGALVAGGGYWYLKKRKKR